MVSGLKLEPGNCKMLKPNATRAVLIMGNARHASKLAFPEIWLFAVPERHMHFLTLIVRQTKRLDNKHVIWVA